MKVVFDTNIFISAVVTPGSRAEEAYRYVITGTVTLHTSVAILTELARVLKLKFKWDEINIVRLIQAIANIATVFKTKPSIHILKDEADNRILECAVKAKAEVIVTGDKHLLDLSKYDGIAIVSLAQFLKMVNR